jgi:hypothetical protein
VGKSGEGSLVAVVVMATGSALYARGGAQRGFIGSLASEGRFALVIGSDESQHGYDMGEVWSQGRWRRGRTGASEDRWMVTLGCDE